MGFVEIRGRSDLDAGQLRILDIYRSSNTVQTSFEHHDTQQSTADIIGAASGKQAGVFLHFWLVDIQEGVLMRLDKPLHGEGAYRAALDGAIDYLAAMGYLMEPKDWGQLDPAAQQQLTGQMPVFGARPQATSTLTQEPDLSTAMLVEAQPVSQGNVALEEHWQVVTKYLASF